MDAADNILRFAFTELDSLADGIEGNLRKGMLDSLPRLRVLPPAALVPTVVEVLDPGPTDLFPAGDDPPMRGGILDWEGSEVADVALTSEPGFCGVFLPPEPDGVDLRGGAGATG